MVADAYVVVEELVRSLHNMLWRLSCCRRMLSNSVIRPDSALESHLTPRGRGLEQFLSAIPEEDGKDLSRTVAVVTEKRGVIRDTLQR